MRRQQGHRNVVTEHVLSDCMLYLWDVQLLYIITLANVNFNKMFYCSMYQLLCKINI